LQGWPLRVKPMTQCNRNDHRVIIAGQSHPKLAMQVAQAIGCKLIMANTQKFANEEFQLQINGDLYDKEVILLQSISWPANDHLMELLFLADAVKRAGGRHIVAVVPYLGYSRQDRSTYDYGPISASLVARLIQTSGIDRLITLDIHSKQIEGFFKIGVKTLETHSLFISDACFYNINNENSVVVSPDIGGLLRARKFAEHLGSDLAVINKKRTLQGKCMSLEVIGKVGDKHCIIIDDIIDTGNTLCNAARLLIEKGARSVSACVTHAVLSDKSIEKIERIGFSQFLITDTIFHQNYPSFIQLQSTAGLIASAL